MPDETRPYRKRRRAELEAATRQRITESAVALHGTLGPARTSMSAVAAHAGVRRSTLYRHFPDAEALLEACSAHWAAANPLPDIGAWAAVEDPDERLRIALRELYAYYEHTRPMLENLIRDADAVPAMRAGFAEFGRYIDAARDILAAGRPARGRNRLRTRAAIGHALAFATWRSLVHEQGLDEDDAVELLTLLVATAG